MRLSTAWIIGLSCVGLSEGLSPKEVKAECVTKLHSEGEEDPEKPSCCPKSYCDGMDSEQKVTDCLAAIGKDCQLSIKSTYEMVEDKKAYCHSEKAFQIKVPFSSKDVQVDSVAVHGMADKSCKDPKMAKIEKVSIDSVCEIPAGTDVAPNADTQVNGEEIDISGRNFVDKDSGVVVTFESCSLKDPQSITVLTTTTQAGNSADPSAIPISSTSPLVLFSLTSIAALSCTLF